MTAPTTVPTLVADWAAGLAGRYMLYYHSTNSLDGSVMSTTSDEMWLYSNGRLVLKHEYTFTSPSGDAFVSYTAYGQWWVTNAAQVGGTAYASISVHVYDSTDSTLIGANSTSQVSTTNGGDFTIDGKVFGSQPTSDVSGPGNDILDASTTANLGPTLLGRAGNDTLIGNDQQYDQLYGGEGNDSLDGRGGDDRLYGQGGDDTLLGGAGDDLALYVSAKSQYALRQIGADLYQLSGPEGSDRLSGVEYIQFASDAPVAIETLVSPGDDTLVGDAAANELYGAAGNDSLSGLAGDDSLYGGEGNDTLAGGAGSDRLDGGAGVDTVSYAGTAATVRVGLGLAAAQNTGGAGSDTLVGIENAIGGSGADILTGSAGANTLEGGDGNDRLEGGAGDDRLDGGNGNDTASYAGAAAAVTVDLANAAAQATGGAGSDTLVAIETLVGSRFGDRLTGNGAANTLNGGLGADTLDGGDGNDIYYVDNAGDRASESNATLAGGGTDTVYATASHSLGANVENLRILAAGAVNATGNGASNVLYAGAGDNILNGGAGLDTASYIYALAAVDVSLALTVVQPTGGSGSDRFVGIEHLAGSNLADRLSGNGGNNTLTGNNGNDTLSGGVGNDILVGGLGNDSLSGGAGRDSFRFNTALNGHRDTLADFSVADDTIQLENAVFTALASTGTLAAGAFRAGPGVTTAGDANDYLIYNSTSGALYYDADGNGAGAAVQFATLAAGLALTNADFLVI